MNTLPLLSLLFVHFYFLFIGLYLVYHLEAGVVPSFDLSFLDQAIPHIEPPSIPLTKLDVAIVCSTISHLLSLNLLSLSTVQKDAFLAAMIVLQSASLDLEVGTFLYGVTHRAPEVFSSIEHVVKENPQVISELEKLMEKKKMSMSNPSYLLTRASKDRRK